MRKKIIVSILSLFVVLVLCGTGETAPYTVRHGDTCYLLSQRFGIPIDDIIRENGLTNAHQLIIGQVLEIPAPAYTVQKGDSLFLIAQRFGTSPVAISNLNRLPGSTIYPSQILFIPSQTTKNTDSTSRGFFNTPDVDLLARIISSEAKGESLEGQVAVGAVILNRLKNPSFSNTLYGVIFEKLGHIYQFEPVINGSIYHQPNPSAIQAARMAINGWDPTGGALFFYNPTKSNSFFFRTLTFLKKIGNHFFYR